MAQGLPLVPPADHVVVPRAVYDRLRHAWNDRVLEASVGSHWLHPTTSEFIYGG